MKRVLVILLMLTGILRGQDEIPREARELGEIHDNAQSYQGWVFALRKLPPEKKSQLIEYLRGVMNKEGKQYPGEDSDRLSTLYFLGDMRARDQLVKNYYRDQQAAIEAITFNATGDPELIPMLAPALLRQERYQRFGSDTWTYPLSFRAASTIIGIVGNSPAFSSEVVNWARRFPPSGSPPDEELREIVREWWEANEPLFLEKNYKAVQPGRDPKSEAVENLAREAAAAPAAAPAPPISTPTAVAPVPFASARDSSTASSGHLLAIAAVALALLVGLLFFLKRRNN